MFSNQPIQSLNVIEVPYLNATSSNGIEKVLVAYNSASVYSLPNLSHSQNRPQLDPTGLTEVETDNIGQLNGLIAEMVASGRKQGEAILMTGGNCCHITGIIGGLQDAHGPDVRVGLVWFDAHGDFNTPNTTLTGMLGGMPVAVAAGLAYPRWRELSHIVSPLPTDRIVMVDVRNLDPAEETLIRATDVSIAAVAEQYPGDDLQTAIDQLAATCDVIYFHIDSDILDGSYVPNHKTIEYNGPSMDEVLAAADVVLGTGKVGVVAMVSIFGDGDGADKAIESGITLLNGVLDRWKKHGQS